MAANAKATAIDSADEDEAEGAAEQTQQKKKWFALPPLKYLLIGGAALFILTGAAGAAYFFLFAGHAAENKVTPLPGKVAVFVDLPEMTVNLSNAGSGSDRTQYLKLRIVLELQDQAMVQQIQPVMPRVMDAFQTYLRELRASDLDGSAGLYRLKEELTRRINSSIAPSRITAVLFKEIVVQ